MKDTEIIEQAQKRFALALEAMAENRKAFLDDVRFYAGEQWDERVQKSREIESRPCLTINRLPQFVRQVTNDMRQNRPSVKVRPADSKADVKTAEVMQGLIRHIESNSNADQAYDNAFFYAVTGGYGFFRIVTDYARDNGFEQEIYIRRIANPNSVYFDPDAQEPDGSDWRWCLITDEIPKDVAEKEYGEGIASWEEAEGDWDGKDTVRIAEYYWIEQEEKTIYLMPDGTVSENAADKAMAIDSRVVQVKKVKWAKICGNKLHEKRDVAGSYIPVIPVFGDEILTDNKRQFVSLIRFAKDPQRMLNYWRSTETELVALQPRAPFLVAEGQIEGYEREWEAANTTNYSYLTYRPVSMNGTVVGAPQRVGFASPPTAVLQGAANAENDLKSTTGIYDASLGGRSNETSGRAIMARQRESDVSTYHYLDNMTRAIRQAGRVLVSLIPTIYDTPRVVRILGDDDSEEMAEINMPTFDRDDDGTPVQRIYDLSLGTYDVVCTAGPSYTTQRQETAEAMMQIIQAQPALMQVAGDLLVKAMDWAGADALADRLKRTIPPDILGDEGKGQPPVPKEAMMEMDSMRQEIEGRAKAMDEMMAHIQKLEQQAGSKQVEAMRAEIDRLKLDIDAYNAETNRLKVVGTAMTPDQVQAIVLQTMQQLATPTTVAEPLLMPPEPMYADPQMMMPQQ